MTETTEPDETPDGDVEEAPQLPAELEAQGGGTCYSARNCTGKVLSNRDGHNCKRTGGKSWRSPLDGQCYNL